MSEITEERGSSSGRVEGEDSREISQVGLEEFLSIFLLSKLRATHSIVHHRANGGSNMMKGEIRMQQKYSEEESEYSGSRQSRSKE